MAPKNKGKGKDASNSGTSDGGGGGKKGGLKPATSINVRHILCEKHGKKEEALLKIRDGRKFDEVAREMSEDKARQGGSLGWKVRGSLLAEFEKVAYDLESSTTGRPKIGECKTSEGYHIIMVEGRK
ncbi:putative peptidyl-prolyl cis-trans isomerase NIMA-interacting 4 [Lophiostoma macrostomum CBS 122681]|uniref:Peptidyl-prolyl cis-trans isomerase n=1 Tax=Lophiostoma macrostomum CBS 122681 TaxID=1314788 RepID=A0A6A6TAU7_9PLEO|nr:putative peptidyl-prolyl cis-trans isomerase NIMA-interacting 4 [Lophiostoma macrostomum CBS 122681]